MFFIYIAVHVPFRPHRSSPGFIPGDWVLKTLDQGHQCVTIDLLLVSLLAANTCRQNITCFVPPNQNLNNSSLLFLRKIFASTADAHPNLAIPSSQQPTTLEMLRFKKNFSKLFKKKLSRYLKSSHFCKHQKCLARGSRPTVNNLVLAFDQTES